MLTRQIVAHLYISWIEFAYREIWSFFFSKIMEYYLDLAFSSLEFKVPIQLGIAPPTAALCKHGTLGTLCLLPLLERQVPSHLPAIQRGTEKPRSENDKRAGDHVT